MIVKVYHGPRYQRGQGLGSMFSGLFRKVVPLARVAAKAAKSPIAKQIGRTLRDTAINVAVDALEGQNDPKETLNTQLRNATVDLLKSQQKGKKRAVLQQKKKKKGGKKKKTYSNSPLFA